MSSASDAARRYFDANTARFLRYGQGGASIHRAVWGPGARTREAAMHFADALVADELAAVGADTPRVLDLGCGVGASLLYLAGRTGARGIGVTLSGVQVARAAELVRAAGMAERVRCLEADYLALPAEIGAVDVAFSIEAFVHSPDAAGYFREAARVVRPGGRLVVCDDFLAREPISPRERRCVRDFERGWRVASLLPAAQVRELAARAGFRALRDLDLTPYLELRRARDVLIGAAVALGRGLPIRSEYWASLRGGDALQRGLESGVIAYRFLVFER